MKKYFGPNNPDVEKDMALLILGQLTPAKILNLRHLSRAWKSLLEESPLYFKLGVKNYAELQLHIANIKSFFGRYLLVNILNEKIDFVDSGLNWNQLQEIDEVFLGIEKSISDGYAVSIWGGWVAECYQNITQEVCRLLVDDNAKTDFFTYCGTRGGTYANFFYNALKKAPEFAIAREGLVEDDESEDAFFAMN